MKKIIERYLIACALTFLIYCLFTQKVKAQAKVYQWGVFAGQYEKPTGINIVGMNIDTTFTNKGYYWLRIIGYNDTIYICVVDIDKFRKYKKGDLIFAYNLLPVKNNNWKRVKLIN